MPYFRFPFPSGESELLDYEIDDHEALTERFRKTLYYGKMPNTDRPSLPLTDIAVELLQETAPRKLGKIDQFMAAATARENCISPCTMMMGMIYVNRLRTKNPEYLQQISSSDLFLISMMMASKFLYDEGVDEEVFNDEWANSADMETDDVNQMEREFLSAIDWNLFVGDKEFRNVLHNIEANIALKQGLDRGWFTYTDLWVLSQDAKFYDISQEISKVVFVSSLTYLTGILTMIGSTVLVTAATATLGPIILHSQGTVAPLPITDVLPVTEPMTQENVTEDKSLPHEVDKPSLTTRTIDNMLSELMTVVSLPTTFVKFWYSALDQLNSGISPSKKTKNQEPPVICSNGPCLPTANPNCQNITNQRAWELLDLCSECQNCREDNYNRFPPKDRYGSMYESRSSVMNRQCGKQTFDCAVKCCCKQGTSGTFSETVVRNMFADVLVGFNTGLSPVYVTT